jgi:hypothetical protein
MLVGDTFLLIVASLLSILALMTGFLMLREVVTLVRDFFGQMGEGSGQPPEGVSNSARRLPARRRATVKRLINHFEGDREGSREAD